MEKEVKELRGTHKFPEHTVATEVRRLDAYQFSGYNDAKFSFGMDSEKTAKVLRDIADRVESGEYILQSGGVFSYAQNDDFQMSVVNIKFHAKKVSMESPAEATEAAPAGLTQSEKS